MTAPSIPGFPKFEILKRLMQQSAQKTFGAWLRARRRARDLTQNELAQQVECAEITIRKIEADQLRPSKRLALALLEQLGVPRSECVALVKWARQIQQDRSM